MKQSCIKQWLCSEFLAKYYKYKYPYLSSMVYILSITLKEALKIFLVRNETLEGKVTQK